MEYYIDIFYIKNTKSVFIIYIYKNHVCSNLRHVSTSVAHQLFIYYWLMIIAFAIVDIMFVRSINTNFKSQF